jgi:hypothetical protein
MDDCRNDSNGDTKIFNLPEDVAQYCVDRGWIFSKYDAHICKECLDDYINEEEKVLIIEKTSYGFERVAIKQKGE